MASTKTRGRLDVRAVSACTRGKVGYATKAAALDAAEFMMRRGRVRPGCHMTPYLCGECREWHVGNRQIVGVREG